VGPGLPVAIGAGILGAGALVLGAKSAPKIVKSAIDIVAGELISGALRTE